VALPFLPSDAGLLALQAGVVALPRPAPQVPFFERLRGPAWALIPVASIVVVVFAIRYVSDTATGLTYLAVVAVPPLAAGALAWAIRSRFPVGRERTATAIAITAALFAVAWIWHRSLAGGAAAAVLSALSCVTLGVLLAAVAPPGWLKLGIIAMAVADTWLVVSDLLQSPNAALVAAHPAGNLPQLQGEIFGTVSMGYGDLFVAALLGAILAGDRHKQLTGAVLTLGIAAAFDLLFLTVSELPATVPVALALIVLEIRDRIRLRPALAARSASGLADGARRASHPAPRSAPR
jgi:hypothetical protein